MQLINPFSVFRTHQEMHLWTVANKPISCRHVLLMLEVCYRCILAR